MKAERIRYEKVKNTGNYSSERLSIELAIEAGEKAMDVYMAARRFVHLALENGSSNELLQTYNALTEIILERKARGEDVSDLIQIQKSLSIPDLG